MSADSDIAIIGRAMKLERQTKRAKLKAENTAALNMTGLPFTSHNDGAHLIVMGFNFWPSTGLWKSRGPTHIVPFSGRGLKKLLDAIESRTV